MIFYSHGFWSILAYFEYPPNITTYQGTKGAELRELFAKRTSTGLPLTLSRCSRGKENCKVKRFEGHPELWSPRMSFSCWLNSSSHLPTRLTKRQLESIPRAPSEPRAHGLLENPVLCVHVLHEGCFGASLSGSCIMGKTLFKDISVKWNKELISSWVFSLPAKFYLCNA